MPSSVEVRFCQWKAVAVISVNCHLVRTPGVCSPSRVIWLSAAWAVNGSTTWFFGPSQVERKALISGS